MTTGRLPAVIDRATDPVVERFLDLVASTGNSTSAARSVGLHRNSFYALAGRDSEFRARWDAAQRQSRSHLAQEVMEKAVVLTGRIVEEPVLDAQGNVVLDDDLEPITVRRLVDYDPRILSTLVNKLLASEDQPITAVQVNLPPPAPPPPAAPRVARLVFSDEPAIDAAPRAAEVAVEASWEDLG